jgi:hypothetical protein
MKIRSQVITRDKVCFVCKTRHDLTAHHIKPRRNGGKTNLKNLMALCHNCHDHVEKHDMEYLEIIKYKKQRWLQSQEAERLPGDKIIVGKDRFGIYVVRDVKDGDSIEYKGLWPTLIRGKIPVTEGRYDTPAHSANIYGD